jgi:hypothetical protein
MSFGGTHGKGFAARFGSISRALAGAAAFAATFILSSTVLASPANAEPVRLLVSVSHRLGLAAEHPLKYADADAARVRDVMVQMGGVKAENATVLAEPSLTQLDSALDKLKADAKKHPAEDVTIIFYFSGHGDREAIHLGESRVLVSDLSARLAQVPAALRIVVTDACRSSREKGMTAEPAFPISLGLLPSARGSVWLNAASDGEAAQESDELQGAIFTHAWLNGLRGAADANGDARVTLDESFAFAHSQTVLRSAKSLGVIQKPEAVMSLTETTPVVLTQTVARQSVVSVPAARDTHYLVYASGAKAVLAEIWGAEARRTALSLPAGRYLVHRRMNGVGGLAHLSIGEGEQRNLEAADFAPASLEVLARKGGDENVDSGAEKPQKSTRYDVFAGYAVGTSSRNSLVHGPELGLAYAPSFWAVTAGLALDLANRTTADSTEQTLTPLARVGFEPRLRLGRVTLFLNGGGRAGMIIQTVKRQNAAELARGGYATSQTESAFTFGPELRAGARVGFLDERLFATLGASGNIGFFQESGAMKAVPTAGGMLAVGGAF